jgi:hypothetical protein
MTDHNAKIEEELKEYCKEHFHEMKCTWIYNCDSCKYKVVRDKLLEAMEFNEEMMEVLKRNYKDMDNIDKVCEMAKVHNFLLMRQDIKNIIEKVSGDTIENILKEGE